MNAVIVVALVFVAFGLVALIAAAVERLPLYPPTEDDILPPPNVRSQRENWDTHEFWQS